MKISRMSREFDVPEWLYRKAAIDNDYSGIEVSDAEHILEKQSDLSEDDLVQERERIEAACEANKVYCCSSTWSATTKSSLKEYANICGLGSDQFREIDPSQIEITQEASSSKMTKTASAEAEAEQINLGDVFKLDREEVDIKGDWEKVDRSAKLAEKPVMFSNGIIPIRGGESYEENSYASTARGQNSLDNPNAIEEYANSEKEDTGARLRRENKERSEASAKKHEAWQQEKIAAMEEGKDIVPKGTVFPTESMNAQPGVQHTPATGGVYSDAQEMPEKTLGEKIADQNEESRKSIQREKADDNWEKMQTEASREVSDVFMDSLKQQLGKGE